MFIRVSESNGRVPCPRKGRKLHLDMVRLANEKPEVKVVNDEYLTQLRQVESQTLPGDCQSDGYGLFTFTVKVNVRDDSRKAIFGTLKLKTLCTVSEKDFLFL